MLTISGTNSTSFSRLELFLMGRTSTLSPLITISALGEILAPIPASPPTPPFPFPSLPSPPPEPSPKDTLTTGIRVDSPIFIGSPITVPEANPNSYYIPYLFLFLHMDISFLSMASKKLHPLLHSYISITH